MKVAVILTGHMRCWKELFPVFKSQIIDRYSPDIFISTWSDEGWWRPHSETGFNEQSPRLDVEGVCDQYCPWLKVMRTEDYLQYDENFKQRQTNYKNYLHNPKNVISMLFKMHSGGSMLEDHITRTGKQYDLVIRMRPDLTFTDIIPDLSPDRFYTLNHKNHLGQGTGDMFQAGSLKDVLNYTKMSVHLDQVYGISNTLCPHIIASTWIEMLKLNWCELQLNKKIWHSPFGEYVPSSGNTVLNLKTEEDNKVY